MKQQHFHSPANCGFNNYNNQRETKIVRLVPSSFFLKLISDFSVFRSTLAATDPVFRCLCPRSLFHCAAEDSNSIPSGKVVSERAGRQELDAGSSILAAAKPSIPHLDETGTNPTVVSTSPMSKMLI